MFHITSVLTRDGRYCCFVSETETRESTRHMSYRHSFSYRARGRHAQGPVVGWTLQKNTSNTLTREKATSDALLHELEQPNLEDSVQSNPTRPEKTTRLADDNRVREPTRPG